MANNNIGSLARILAVLALVFFPLAASAAQDKTLRAPARSPAAAPAKPPINLLHEAEAWGGWGENRIKDFSGEVGGIRVERFLIKPEPRRACGDGTSKTTSASGDWYLPDGGDTLCDFTKTAGGAETFTGIYVSPGIDGRVARIDGTGAATYYMADGLGSVHQVTNASGVVTGTNFSDAWGNKISLGLPPPTGPGSRYAFQGREDDNESGLQFFRARSYDAMTGRFTSRDPVPHSNLYHFADNDPVNKTDPSGRDPEDWWDDFTGWTALSEDENVQAGASGFANHWTNGGARDALGNAAVGFYEGGKERLEKTGDALRTFAAHPGDLLEAGAGVEDKTIVVLGAAAGAAHKFGVAASDFLEDPAKGRDAFVAFVSEQAHAAGKSVDDYLAQDPNVIAKGIGHATYDAAEAAVVAAALAGLASELKLARAADVVDFGPGANGGELCGDAKEAKLRKYLEKRKVDLEIGEVDEHPSFSFKHKDGELVGRPKIRLPAGATNIQVRHEVAHWLDLRKLGPVGYENLGEAEREMRVFRKLNQAKSWGTYTEPERRAACDYAWSFGEGGK